MGEHVDDPGRLLVPVDQELLDARVFRQHDLAADRYHLRVGYQVVGGDAGAVDHDGRGAGQFGERADRRHLDRAAGPLESGAQVVQVDGHGGERGGVVPAAVKPSGSSACSHRRRPGSSVVQ